MEPILDEQISNNPDGYKACYNCGETNYKKVTYSWWGGLIGPKLLSHVKCNVCGTQYNGKTGQSNTKTIVIYMIVTFSISALVLLFLLF